VLAYTRPRYQLGAIVENLLNVQWNWAQFATLTRLLGEPAEGKEGLFFTPGTPFYLKPNASIFF